MLPARCKFLGALEELEEEVVNSFTNFDSDLACLLPPPTSSLPSHMPRGRPRLEPDVKTQNLSDSRKRYEEKNIERRREAAKLRMQRKRAEIAASDNSTRRKYLCQAASNSERYRDRKHAQEREERRTANVVIKKARTREKVDLRKKHKPLPKSSPPAAKPLPKLPPTVAKPPHRRRAPSPITPAPAPRCPAPRCPAPRSAHAAVEEQVTDSMDDESDEEEDTSLPIEAPIWPTRARHPQRCPHCYQDDCVGCACLCSESDEWFDHPEPLSGYQSSKVTSRFVILTFSSHWLCLWPDPGHEDRWDHPGPFYAVVSETAKWRGVVTSSASLERMKQRYPDARTFKASPWLRFDELWTMDCNEYHNHEGEHPAPEGQTHYGTPESSAPSSPSTLTESTASRPPSPSPSSASPTKSGLRKENAPRNASRMSKEELAYLASSRPSPGPISKNRLTQQFARVLGPQAVAPFVLPRAREEPRTTSPARQRTHPAITAAENNVVEKIDAGARSSTPVLYAVSGRNRVFKDRNRAMAVLQGTPGADLLFTRNEDELFEFLAEEVAGKMKM
ncbi:hypothetical protein B0H14DRAFT_3549500 [Mycena olivaceomarginata]|nr:hypothetical protein B0H14DRAFT_3549500 [Mycena olivaceomarginata]